MVKLQQERSGDGSGGARKRCRTAALPHCRTAALPRTDRATPGTGERHDGGSGESPFSRPVSHSMKIDHNVFEIHG
jgi:hypothetical protein